MSLESKKTNQIRTDEFKFKYLSKKVLDIGAGPDPVVSGCTVFDVEDGDANNINSYFKKLTFLPPDLPFFSDLRPVTVISIQNGTHKTNST